MICTQYARAYEEARQRGVLTRNALGEPYEYRYTGASQFFVGQVDFTHPDAFDFYGDLLDEAVGRRLRRLDGGLRRVHAAGRHGARRLDRRGAPQQLRGRITPPPARTPATARRGRWPASTAPAGPARRAHSQIVWGGDPTTSWGFDGLESAIKNGLTMGLSGVSTVGLGHRRLLRPVRAADDA